MPVRPLPANPDLKHLRYEAKDLLKAHRLRGSDTAQRIREFHPRFRNASDGEIFQATFKLADAQLTIARERGFASWPKLKRRVESPSPSDRLDLPHHERIADPTFRRAVELLDAGDVEALRALLRDNPGLAKQRVLFEGGNYFRNPSLIEFVAENPTRRNTLPGNIIEVARVILEAGVTREALDETLGLVASSLVAHQRGVQVALIDLLCEYGAEANSALRVAAMHGEFEAVEALMRHGARLDLAMASALGRVEDARRLLKSSNEEERHWAMAMASHFGHVEIVRMLLDGGEDPNRYNPVGGHAHSTPLHQAAAMGDLAMLRLLVKRGARLDQKDTMWQATPAEWARHEGKSEAEAYLRERMKAGTGEQ